MALLSPLLQLLTLLQEGPDNPQIETTPKSLSEPSHRVYFKDPKTMNQLHRLRLAPLLPTRWAMPAGLEQLAVILRLRVSDHVILAAQSGFC